MSTLENQRKANIIEFKETVSLGLQQTESLLSPRVQTKTHHGEKSAILQIFKQTEVHKIPEVDRPETKLTNTEQDRRWIDFHNYGWAETTNPFIQLEQDINPFIPYEKSAVAAFKRKQDEVILEGMLGINKTGKSGEKIEHFPASNILRYPQYKIAKAKSFKESFAGRIVDGLVWLAEHEVDIDRESITVLVPPVVYRHLFDVEQVINRDYTGSANLDAGRVRYFAGVNILLFKKVPGDSQFPTSIEMQEVDTINNYYCPMWCSSSVELGIWSNVTVSHDRLPTHYNAHQLMATASYGAARLEPNKIVCIEVDKDAASVHEAAKKAEEAKKNVA